MNPDQSIRHEDVLDEIKRIVAEQMGIDADTILPEHSLTKDINCDSLDLVEIMMEAEEQFDITIPDNIASEADTITDVTHQVIRILAP